MVNIWLSGRRGNTVLFQLDVFILFYIGAQLINNAVLVSGLQQSDSVVHIHESILSQIFFHLGYYRILCRAACAIQQIIVDYLFYIQQSIYINLNLRIYPSPHYLSPLGNSKFVFQAYESVSVLCISSFVSLSLDSIHT